MTMDNLQKCNVIID